MPLVRPLARTHSDGDCRQRRIARRLHHNRGDPFEILTGEVHRSFGPALDRHRIGDGNEREIPDRSRYSPPCQRISRISTR